MDSAFFQSVLVQPAEVLGKRLHPFSCYHALVLAHFDSPFLIGGEASRQELIFAVWVCTTRFEDGPALLQSDDALKGAMEWGKSFAKTEPDFEQGRDDFQTYLKNYMRFPQLWTKKGQGKPSGVPWPFRIAATVWAHFDVTEAEAWNMGLNKAASYRACVAEDNGMEVVSERIQGMIDRGELKSG